MQIAQGLDKTLQLAIRKQKRLFGQIKIFLKKPLKPSRVEKGVIKVKEEIKRVVDDVLYGRIGIDGGISNVINVYRRHSFKGLTEDELESLFEKIQSADISAKDALEEMMEGTMESRCA